MDCGLGTAAPPPDLRIAVIVQRIEQKPLPLGFGAEGQHRHNFIQRLPLADQFLRGGAVGQNALGGDYVMCGCSKTAVYDSIEGVRKKFFKFYR